MKTNEVTPPAPRAPACSSSAVPAGVSPHGIYSHHLSVGSKPGAHHLVLLEGPVDPHVAIEEAEEEE